MSSQKKLLIAIIAVCVALVSAIVTLIVVFVSSAGSTTSNINVSFSATNVSAIVQASYTIDGTKTTLKNGNQTSVVFDGKTSSGGYLNNGGSTIELEGEQIVFEYVITNTSPDVPIKVQLVNNSSIVSNFTIGYAYSTTKVTDYSTLTTSTSYTTQTITPDATTASSTMYIYVVLNVTDSSIEGTFTGSFAWKLTR